MEKVKMAEATDFTIIVTIVIHVKNYIYNGHHNHT